MLYKIAILFLFAVFFGCQWKATPVIAERKYDLQLKQTEISDKVIIADTLAGQQIFSARCRRCHGLPDPAQYSIKKWETILASMIPRSRVSKEQAVHLAAYINSNADK